MTDPIDLFSYFLKHDDLARKAKGELTDHEARLKPIISAAETERDKALAEIQAEMLAQGVLEQLLPYDAMHVVRLYFTTPRESVVGDADAAPDQFVTRSLKKAEVAKHLKALRERNEPEPNWARLEMGEKKLAYVLEKAK